MEEAKQRFSNKLKVTKRTNTKATAAKTQSTKAGKSLVAIMKTATGISKEFKISFKSKTMEKMNNDEFLCKHTQSAELTSINLSAISAISSSDIMSGKSRKYEQSTDSQETITDVSSSETRATRTPKNLKLDESHTCLLYTSPSPRD